MILISIRISLLHFKLVNHSLKFRNQIGSEHMLSWLYPNSYYSILLLKLSLLYVFDNIMSPYFILCFHH